MFDVANNSEVKSIRLVYDDKANCWVGTTGMDNVAWLGPTPLAVAVQTAVHVERQRCAAIADDEARIREEAGKTHPEDSEARGRCFAGARAAQNVARGIRGGEVV